MRRRYPAPSTVTIYESTGAAEGVACEPGVAQFAESQAGDDPPPDGSGSVTILESRRDHLGIESRGG